MSLRIAFAVLILLAGPASAGDTPSVQEIVDKLRPAPVAGYSLRMRGVTVEDAAAQPTSPPSINLTINFEFGSARLTTDAAIVLDNLGRALNDPALQPLRFLVAGHTDGVGRPDVNMRLSASRARSVADYLTRRHGVAADRLESRGLGSTQLLYADDPTNGSNRRVQIVTLAPNS